VPCQPAAHVRTAPTRFLDRGRGFVSKRDQIGIEGRRVSFAENVFYECQLGKILRIWSVIDKAAIERQLR
jgi:predicted ester cyclase